MTRTSNLNVFLAMIVLLVTAGTLAATLLDPAFTKVDTITIAQPQEQPVVGPNFDQVRVDWDHFETSKRLEDAKEIHRRYRKGLCQEVRAYYNGAEGVFLVLCKTPDNPLWGGMFVHIGPTYKNYAGDPTTLLWRDIHIHSMYYSPWPRWANVILGGFVSLTFPIGTDWPTLVAWALQHAGFYW